jgi:hypothetical protein
LNILISLKEKYSGKKIGVVTETLDNAGIFYYVRLEDDKFLWTVKATSSAQLEVVEKLRKQQN